MIGYTYILLCGNGSYYVGSTKYLEERIRKHISGNGANHTKKYLPVVLVYYEEHSNIYKAFLREKQIKGWRRVKKEALINGDENLLKRSSRNYTEFPNDIGC